MRLRANVVEAEFALGIAGDKGSVFHEQPHVGDARLAGILDTVAIAIGKDLADDETAVAENTGQNLHGCRCLIADLRCDAGCHTGAECLGAVDAIALQRAGADADPVSQDQHITVLDRAGIENQFRPDAALGLGQSGAVESHQAGIQACAAPHIGKAGRQVVFKLNLAEQLAAGIFYLDGVVHEVTEIDRAARGGFFNEQATQVAGVKGHVDMHRSGSQIDQKLAAIGAFWIGSPACRQKSGWKDRREAVAARWCHPQCIGARRDGREFKLAGWPGHHRMGGGRDAVSLKHDGG